MANIQIDHDSCESLIDEMTCGRWEIDNAMHGGKFAVLNDNGDIVAVCSQRSDAALIVRAANYLRGYDNA